MKQANIHLKGMTWSHPRGYDPMVACSKIWQETAGVSISWDKRSLQDFETYPVEELAKSYDLIVIDHPHVGQITDEGCLAPLDEAERAAELRMLISASIGGSVKSYYWRGHQWALPIDAAAQVQAYRPDRQAGPLQSWQDVLKQAEKGEVILPLLPPHSLMSFYTLCANSGTPCNVTENTILVDRETGKTAYLALAELAARIIPDVFAMDPIAVLEDMTQPDSRHSVSPLIYGYVNYAITGFRPNPVIFDNIAGFGGQSVAGSALGGTGIAVSAFCQHRNAAIDFAYWVAGKTAQSGPYWQAGGQPAHAQAWENTLLNRQTGNFYRNTAATLKSAWVRPRHYGYMAFQTAAATLLTNALRDQADADKTLDQLDVLFAKSFA